MKSIYGRQFAAMVAMVLVSFLMLGASFATLSYQFTIKEKENDLQSSAGYLASFTSDFVNTFGSTAWRNVVFRQYVNMFALMTDSNVMLCTTEGTVLFATDGQNELTEQESAALPDGVIADILEDSYAGTTTLDGLFSEPRYLVGMSIRTDDGFLQGMILISSSITNIRELWKQLLIVFVLTSLAVILIAAIISSVASMHQSQPMKEIAAAARQFGHGEFDVRVDVGNRQDEVGELAESFNSMADSLSRSEKNRNEFIANVSHELKTPMTTIAGFADGILDGTIPPEKEKEYLQVISSETRRLSRLVRSMLDLSRMESNERATQQQFDINETLVRTLVSIEGRITAKMLDVQTDFPEEAVLVWGDADAITQVCYNLLDNAIKFSKTGGVLGLSVTAKGRKASITISNEGDTIPPEELPLIFERFHKTDHSRSVDREGVGLGLYIVKTILNHHNENIVCTSENGVTKFTFTLTRA